SFYRGRTTTFYGSISGSRAASIRCCAASTAASTRGRGSKSWSFSSSSTWPSCSRCASISSTRPNEAARLWRPLLLIQADDDLAEVRGGGQVRIGLLRLGEGEDAVHDGLDMARRERATEPFEHRH